MSMQFLARLNEYKTKLAELERLLAQLNERIEKIEQRPKAGRPARSN
jgi:hypothetical protein